MASHRCTEIGFVMGLEFDNGWAASVDAFTTVNGPAAVVCAIPMWMMSKPVSAALYLAMQRNNPANIYHGDNKIVEAINVIREMRSPDTVADDMLNDVLTKRKPTT